jgi:4-carboxymuconolactone decarboxylase
MGQDRFDKGLKLHVKAALNNGVTREEIREVLLQVAVYCGVPAGIDSVRIAREAFAELDRAKKA